MSMPLIKSSDFDIVWVWVKGVGIVVMVLDGFKMEVVVVLLARTLLGLVKMRMG